MENITEILNSFSDKHDLWNLTKKSALEYLENSIEEEKVNDTKEFKGLNKENFVLVKKKQDLVFWYYENETFIVRTTYTLFTDKDENQSFPFGEYTLEVDSEGQPIDDWMEPFLR